MNSLNRFADPVFCIARLIIGLMFVCHGSQKLLGFPPGGHGAGQGIMLIGAWIELVAGVLIAFGFLTRIAAFIASGEMAAAYFMMHWPFVFEPIAKAVPLVNKGEGAVFYCWFFFFVFFYGPGRWSIDAMLFRKNTSATMPSTPSAA